MPLGDEKPPMLDILFVIGNVSHNVPNFTVQNFAENINGVCTYTFVPFQSGNLTWTYMILLNQRILGDSFLFHHIPEVVVCNHNIHSSLSS